MYMSPEQARRSRLESAATGVFSLGAVLFEMLTGKRPACEIRDEVTAWNEVALGQLPSVRAMRNPDLPEPFERLLARALAPDPEGRFADAAAFGTAIRGVLAGMVNTPVGASDLQLLLSDPAAGAAAARARARAVRRSSASDPEAQALGEAIAGAAARPLPAVAPGMTPPAPRPPSGITNLAELDADLDDDVPSRSPARPVRASPRVPAPGC